MADRLSLDDLVEHVGCRHGLEATTKAAVRDWFTVARVNSLRTALEAAVPTVTWTNERILRAVRATAEDLL
jgi:hypothetical protein